MGTRLGVACPDKPPKIRHLPLLRCSCFVPQFPPWDQGDLEPQGDGGGRAGSGLGCAAISVPLPPGRLRQGGESLRGAGPHAKDGGVQGERGGRRHGAGHRVPKGLQPLLSPTVVPAQPPQLPPSPRPGILPTLRFPLAAAASSSSSASSPMPCSCCFLLSLRGYLSVRLHPPRA